MKIVPLRTAGAHVSATVLRQVTALSPENRIDIDEMRRRCRILDAIEKAGDSLLLEDADYEVLKKAVETFPFQVAHRELLAIIDDVLNAKEPPAQS